jgi:hypothetical protein
MSAANDMIGTWLSRVSMPLTEQNSVICIALLNDTPTHTHMQIHSRAHTRHVLIRNGDSRSLHNEGFIDW